MPKLISRARGYFRKKKSEPEANHDGLNSEPTNVLKKRISTLSKRMAKLKLQLHDLSLAYLQMVQSRLYEKVGRKRQRRHPVVERRKLGTLALRLKSTATRMINRVGAGKVLVFPSAEGGSAIKDPNS
jgi:hypothetical protein